VDGHECCFDDITSTLVYAVVKGGLVILLCKIQFELAK